METLNPGVTLLGAPQIVMKEIPVILYPPPPPSPFEDKLETGFCSKSTLRVMFQFLLSQMAALPHPPQVP